MGAQVDTAHADQENEEEEPSCDSPPPPPVVHSLEEEDKEHPIKHGRRQGVATRKTMGGMKERLGRQGVRWSRAVNRLFHPALQQGDAESIEDQKKKQPPVGELPEKDTYLYRDKDLGAACPRHSTEQRGEKRGVSGLDDLVHQLLPRQEIMVGRRQSETNEEEYIEESKKEGARHTVGWLGLPFAFASFIVFYANCISHSGAQEKANPVAA